MIMRFDLQKEIKEVEELNMKAFKHIAEGEALDKRAKIAVAKNKRLFNLNKNQNGG